MKVFKIFSLMIHFQPTQARREKHEMWTEWKCADTKINFLMIQR